MEREELGIFRRHQFGGILRRLIEVWGANRMLFGQRLVRRPLNSAAGCENESFNRVFAAEFEKFEHAFDIDAEHVVGFPRKVAIMERLRQMNNRIKFADQIDRLTQVLPNPLDARG